MEKKEKLMLVGVSLLIFIVYFSRDYFVEGLFSLFHLTGNYFIYAKFISKFIFLFILLFVYRSTFKRDIKDLKNNFKSRFLKGLKIFIIGFLCYVFCNFIISSLNLFEYVPNDFETMYDGFEKNAVLMFFMSTFYYPIVEEIVFKKSFKDLLKNKWLFVIATGLINAVCNIILSVNDPRDFIYLIPNSIFSMCFSYIYYETNNLIVPIVYRILYNLIPSIVAFIASMTLISL